MPCHRARRPAHRCCAPSRWCARQASPDALAPVAAPRRASHPPFLRALRALARDHGRPAAQNNAPPVLASPTCFGASRPPATSSLTPIIRGHRRLSAAFAARHDESRAAAKFLRRRVEMRGKSGVFRVPPRKNRRAGTALLRGSHCAGLEAARGFRFVRGGNARAVADKLRTDTKAAGAAWGILGVDFF